MTIDELELERITQEVMEYVSRHLAATTNYEEWLEGMNYYDYKIFIKEIIKRNVFTFGRDDGYIEPMYKSFVLGLKIARGQI